MGGVLSLEKPTILLKIPAGVDDGSQIRLSGEGDAGTKAGSPGNLFITLTVEEHELFTRDGDDIHYELPIDFAQAALGTEVEVPTLDGKTKLKISPSSQTGTVFQIKGKGFPHLHRGGRGNLLITLVVVPPQSLTEKQHQLLHELANTLGPANMPPPRRWRETAR